MEIIFHITSRATWEAAQQAGSYRAESLVTEGFIHFSRRDQLLWVANRFYLGQTDLVLLVVDAARVAAELRDEGASPSEPDGTPAPDDSLFPHLYGPLNLDAVIDVVDFAPTPDGKFAMPPQLES